MVSRYSRAILAHFVNLIAIAKSGSDGSKLGRIPDVHDGLGQDISKAMRFTLEIAVADGYIPVKADAENPASATRNNSRSFGATCSPHSAS